MQAWSLFRGKIGLTGLIVNKNATTDLGWRLYPLTFFEQYRYGSLADYLVADTKWLRFNCSVLLILKAFFHIIAFAFSICLKKTSYLCRFVLMLCAVWLRYSADVVPVITKRSMMISVAIYRNWKGISSKCTLGKCRLHSVVCGEYIFWPFTINLFGNCVAFGLEYLPLYNIVECYLLRGCCCGYMVIWLLSQMSEFWSIFYILKTFLSYLSILTL